MEFNCLKRQIDALGRIVIPKDIRNQLKIKNGETLKFLVQDDAIILKKFSPINDKKIFLQEYINFISEVLKKEVLLTDRTKFIVTGGKKSAKYYEKEISDFLDEHLNKRSFFIEKHYKDFILSNGIKEEGFFIINAILINSEVIGLVIIYSNTEELTDLDEFLAKKVVDFLVKFLE